MPHPVTTDVEKLKAATVVVCGEHARWRLQGLREASEERRRAYEEQAEAAGGADLGLATLSHQWDALAGAARVAVLPELEDAAKWAGAVATCVDAAVSALQASAQLLDGEKPGHEAAGSADPDQGPGSKRSRPAVSDTGESVLGGVGDGSAQRASGGAAEGQGGGTEGAKRRRVEDGAKSGSVAGAGAAPQSRPGTLLMLSALLEQGRGLADAMRSLEPAVRALGQRTRAMAEAWERAAAQARGGSAAVREVEQKAYDALGAAAAAGGESAARGTGPGGRTGGLGGLPSSGAGGADGIAGAGGESVGGGGRGGGRVANERGSGPFGGRGSLRYEEDESKEPPVACIVVLDSISAHHSRRKCGAMVRRYCQRVYEALYAPPEYRFLARRAREEGLSDDDPRVPERFLESPERLPVVCPRAGTPQQANNVDCGVYAAEFARLWILRALGPHVTRRAVEDGFGRSVLLGEDDMMAPGGIHRRRRQLARAAVGMAMDKVRRVDKVVEARRRGGLGVRGGAGGAAGGEG